jgi:hypothetical protein
MRTKSGFYPCALVTCANALTSAAFSVAMLWGHPLTDAAAMYGVARSVPLAVAALIATVRRSYIGIAVLGPLLASIQACDAIVGWVSHDFGKTIGPLVLAVLTLASVIVFSRNRVLDDTGRGSGNHIHR